MNPELLGKLLEGCQVVLCRGVGATICQHQGDRHKAILPVLLHGFSKGAGFQGQVPRRIGLGLQNLRAQTRQATGLDRAVVRLHTPKKDLVTEAHKPYTKPLIQHLAGGVGHEGGSVLVEGILPSQGRLHLAVLPDLCAQHRIQHALT